MPVTLEQIHAGIQELLRREEISKASKASVIEVHMVNANQEYLHMLPIDCKKFTLHVRDGTAIRIAFERGLVAKPNPGYWTHKANTSWSEDDLNLEGNVWLYFACASAGKMVEIIQWTRR